MPEVAAAVSAKLVEKHNINKIRKCGTLCNV